MTIHRYKRAQHPRSEAHRDFDDFVKGYVACLLWTGHDESAESGGVPLDKNYSASDITSETMKKIKRDCAEFMKVNKVDLAQYAAKRSYNPAEGTAMDYAGHDFCLTRNGHGAGFWDRGLGDLGQRLTEASKKFGEQNLYVGDNGKLYV